MDAQPVAMQLDLFPQPAYEPALLDSEQRLLQTRYDRLAVQYGLPAARVMLSTRRATGGVITYGPPHVIRISAHMSSEDRLQTLLHEATHAICHARWGPDEGHSARFWALARRLGVRRRSAPETERLREVRAANARYAYRCPTCTEEWTRRKPFGRARLCAACAGKGRPAKLILVRRPRPARSR
jgi:predicted SprT family Zn-dependent metalloprotease